MMVVWLVAARCSARLALLADGLHMASHAVRSAFQPSLMSDAGRTPAILDSALNRLRSNALGGFTGSTLLAVFALFMAVEMFGQLLKFRLKLF